MSLNNNQDSVTFELEYKGKNGSQIKLFGSNFVEKNKDKCKIIYNEKEYDLILYFKLDNNYNHNGHLKIRLIINNNITDISGMFFECNELLSITDYQLIILIFLILINHLMEIIVIIIMKNLIIHIKLIKMKLYTMII